MRDPRLVEIEEQHEPPLLAVEVSEGGAER